MKAERSGEHSYAAECIFCYSALRNLWGPWHSLSTTLPNIFMSMENVNWDPLRGSREGKSFKGDAKDFRVGTESSAVRGFAEVKDWWDSERCCLVWNHCKTYCSFCINPGKGETWQSVRNIIKCITDFIFCH